MLRDYLKVTIVNLQVNFLAILGLLSFLQVLNFAIFTCK